MDTTLLARKPMITQLAIDTAPPEIAKAAKALRDIAAQRSAADTARDSERSKLSAAQDIDAAAHVAAIEAGETNDPGTPAFDLARKEIADGKRKAAALAQVENTKSNELISLVQGKPGQKWINSLEDRATKIADEWFSIEQRLVQLGVEAGDLLHKIEWLKAGGTNRTMTEAQRIRFNPAGLNEVSTALAPYESRGKS